MSHLYLNPLLIMSSNLTILQAYFDGATWLQPRWNCRFLRRMDRWIPNYHHPVTISEHEGCPARGRINGANTISMIGVMRLAAVPTEVAIRLQLRSGVLIKVNNIIKRIIRLHSCVVSARRMFGRTNSHAYDYGGQKSTARARKHHDPAKGN